MRVFGRMRGHIAESLMAPPKTVTNGHEGGVARGWGLGKGWRGGDVGRWKSMMGMETGLGSPTGPLYPRFIINHAC